MASFVSGAVNRGLFSSVTQNVLGFASAVTLAQGGGGWTGAPAPSGFEYRRVVFRGVPVVQNGARVFKLMKVA